MNRLVCSVDRGLNRLYTFSGYIAAGFLVAICLLVCANIISRLLSTYVPGLTEYSGYAMAAASFLALAYTFQHKGHIRVELMLSHLTGTKRWIAELWCLGMASLISMFLAYYLCRLTYFSWKFEEHSEGADAILLWIPQSIAALGAVVLCLCVIHHLIKSIYTQSISLSNQ